MERSSRPPTFTDAAVADLGGPRAAAFFAACDRDIDWQRLAAPLAELYSPDPSAPGRAHWPVVQMLKIMLMQKWFHLSDPMMEEMLKDRISFRRFVGLSLDDATPDETTLCRFRGKLLEHGLGATLFDQVLACLKERGLVLQEGTLIDATIIEAPLGAQRKDGTRSTDPAARKTVKGGRAYFGYRAHIATDRHGLIKDYIFDTASVSEHTHFDRLAEPEAVAIYADSGCRSQARVQALEARGVFAGLCHRRVRGQKELTAPQRQFNRLVAGIRAAVEHPFAWMAQMGYGRTRYRGCQRNALDFCLHAVAYNLKRAMSLACVWG
jgi:IS5 family transposase